MPPSETALRLLLEDIDPLNAQFFGSGRFKSVGDLFRELMEGSSTIRWSCGRLVRHCEPVILQLQWRGYLLVKTHEMVEGRDYPVQRMSFIGTRILPGELWRTALARAVDSDLLLTRALLLDSLEPSHRVDAECHMAVRETAVSPSFPGLVCSYNSHLVRWTLKEEQREEVLKFFGLPVDPDNRDPALLGSDFTTTKFTGDCRKRTLYWRWLPFSEAQRIQRFVNIGEATADERWAKYAFQKEGAVQFPPTEGALAILLRRCGVETEAFGHGDRCTLHDLWLELANQESHLLMRRGNLQRVVEVTVLKLRWHEAHTESKVLVLAGGNEGLRLPYTRKRRDEAWEDSAARLLVDDLALGVTWQQMRGLLASRAGERTECGFVEELKDEEDHEGMPCLTRTHLVKFTLREDAAASPRAKDLGLRGGATESKRGAWNSRSRVIRASKLEEDARMEWVGTSRLKAQEVAGAELWRRHGEGERHRVSSVLLGLEGSAPSTKSPWGQAHDSSGKSAEVSAVGNHKWRAYRARGALQVPADEGGLRMCVTRPMFEELLTTCTRLGLGNASLDLVAHGGTGLPRWVLDQRYAERELFKQVLAGSGQEARQAVAWMAQYRAAHRPPEQAHAAMYDSKWRQF
eukprot:CAMPEP_0171133264 /NCGR_PEP_ID=MMETSP0766_2-20121228/125962_1 /TAXON_ID=439317 /ORGANISM="Gambierdiscus australes, Strain CAWD 149" /LENGTH=631 /DNA_ID=CAMNT_0011596635 /DNA_START=87 /DNA_END=1982 /DNA_ORIENTATION=-